MFFYACKKKIYIPSKLFLILYVTLHVLIIYLVLDEEAITQSRYELYRLRNKVDMIHVFQ